MSQSTGIVLDYHIGRGGHAHPVAFGHSLRITMTSQAIGDLICSRGHRNPSSSRYCQYCGDKLNPPDATHPQMIGDRYRVVRELGRGGFGHTYLVEDINRFNETCVIKEFAPEINHQDSLQKAKELFSREAEVLYRLQHPQIPRFRECFMDEKLHSLFLAQDYVVGPTYFALLQQRKAQGKAFSEGEVLQFLRDALPILDYIHEQGVIHRDISPDNLICRQDDQRPILIDFGGVKQVTITVGNWKKSEDSGKNITLIGKPAYAPEEQIRLGQVNPSSDIYSLGVTALSLLMGKEPQEFFDAYQHQFNWRELVQVQPHFATLLDKMTAPRASDRYRSATQVLSDLPRAESANAVAPPTTPHTLIVSPANSALPTPAAQTTTPPTPTGTAVVLPPAQPKVKKMPAFVQGIQRAVVGTLVGLVKTLLIISGLLGLGALGWWMVQSRLADLGGEAPPNESTNVQVSQAERERRQAILDRVTQLNIPDGYFNRVTNEAFYLQYPEQRGRLLNGTSAEDEILRGKWYDVAQQVLEVGDQLSDRTRSRLGRFGQNDVNRIEQELDQQQIDRDRFLREVERDLLRRLPMYRGEPLNQQQVNQLRLALASERALSR